jgi:ABC-type polar amino acid transport system ATPase subunit
MFSCQNISKSNLFDNISISVNSGEIVALIGSNGSGKTSVLRHLAMLDKADSGSILIDNLELVLPNDHEPNIHPKVTMVSQNELLYPHLIVRNNILLAADIKQNKFDELVNYFEIKLLLNKFPNELSGGQKQIVALIRSVILEPKYLLLDEITSALDSQHTHIVTEYLLNLKSQSCGIIIITHSMTLAKKLADKVYFLDSGRIIEFGVIDILKKPKTKELQNYLQFC